MKLVQLSGRLVRRFASNIGILLLNKHLLGGYGFRYPIFLTLCHMLACVVLSQVSAPVVCTVSASCGMTACSHGNQACRITSLRSQESCRDRFEEHVDHLNTCAASTYANSLARHKLPEVKQLVRMRTCWLRISALSYVIVTVRHKGI